MRGNFTFFSLPKLEAQGFPDIARFPYSIKILLENALRNVDGVVVTQDDVTRIARWGYVSQGEIPFLPARVLMQDFTGVPAVVDLAAMREAVRRGGGEPESINPLIPVDLVVDHSIQVDAFGSADALQKNTQREFERNRERYQFLRWGQQAFRNFRVVPPATGIVHQVNLEYLARVVMTDTSQGETRAFPDTVVGTDSHTTMINGLGVLGWGVGGIEAEAAMLGQPVCFLLPEVVGVRLEGELKEGVTATDLVLRVTEVLRQHGVVDKFVEFTGPGMSHLSLADRATIANMAPEYGATVGFFPVDDETLVYLKQTGREPELLDLTERYLKEQGMFRTLTSPEPVFLECLTIDMSEVESAIAGPKRPQDRLPLPEVPRAFQLSLTAPAEKNGYALAPEATQTEAYIQINNKPATLRHGSVVIAAITSCTNTSNPSVMMAAGLLAKKAAERGLRVDPHIKTSLAPGSRVVTRYLEKTGLLGFLEQLGFHVVGYGCTTCIGNSGPLPEEVGRAVKEQNLVVASILSGNRNFEGRVHPHVKANFLASPPLVVAYALAGRVDIDFTNEPIGMDRAHQPVFLKDLWPSAEELQSALRAALDPQLFQEQYRNVSQGNTNWNNMTTPTGVVYEWEPASTYIKEPPYFEKSNQGGNVEARDLSIHGARALAVVGDSVTTDHISPAGDISKNSPAADYLREHGVEPRDFNSYGSRRGNHEVMMRGTFANVRLKNLLAPGTEGGVTTYLPNGEQMSIFDAAMRYQKQETPLLVLAGKDYGMGSSRDWAAKGPALLGVRAVIAVSFERIHRSNLIGMGVLPLQFRSGESASTLELAGKEIFDIEVPEHLQPGQSLTVRADEKTFEVTCRIDTPIEFAYVRAGGILPYVMQKVL